MADSTIERSASRCPTCDAELAANAVLCIECGYHLEKGIRIPTTAVRPPQPAAELANPFHSPATITNETTVLDMLRSIFWIDGRIPRWQWWSYQVGFYGLIFALGGLMENQLIAEWLGVITVYLALWLLFVAQVKRWHDMDKSGLWCLVNLIPILGGLYAIIELGFQRGTEGENEYGKDPLAPRHRLSEY